MLTKPPLTRDLVLIGGGHAHALVLRAWGMKPLPGARLTVINPGPTAPYTGMLPGHVAGHYGRDDLEIDLVRLCRFSGARLILSHASGIDRSAREIFVEGQEPVAYDVASIDIGITAQMSLPGFAEHAVGAKPLDRYARVWRQFRADVAAGARPARVAVIGGGVAGCELAMAMAHALREDGQAPQVSVIEAGSQISGVGAAARRRLGAAMDGLGVRFIGEARIARIAAQAVVLEDGTEIAAAFCVGAAGATPHGWLAQTDLPLHEGFVTVDPYLRVTGDPHLFAVGDCAHLSFAPRPKAGVFAVRAAPVLRHNLVAALAGGALRRFHPQRSYLKLISLGEKSALAEKFGVAVAAPTLWRWKDRIDRAFMDRLGDLPAMTVPKAPTRVARGADDLADPLCGGCGAKVGGALLRGAVGRGDDAAIVAQPGGGFQVISVDHLRGFVEDPVTMTRIAALHALGDIWAMGAAPQSALSSLILPRMSEALQARTLREITQTARAVFAEAGAELIGGHTTMGAELTIGFTVTGTRENAPITLDGARAGDVLLLTRPVGSGVILAADMAGRAPGQVVADLLRRMTEPQDVAARLLSGANAMTDVTGFGLLGHVQQICAASGLRAEIDSAQVPVYAGARALSDAGERSSLLRANTADVAIAGQACPLLFDPQTAGGLLAALPEKDARVALDGLRAAGKEGWIIGALSDGRGPIRVS
ncbi:selenide, water dikinase SelD [Sulfitobacter albidus]|uniref:Selenide, water dikinase SelD n=1 Tax=Sulfitobacter albidus TaxID=2829501 RepID=A0A975JHA9_9RHOB|nr:selenide, water dikinase SelD [Sulfitobacter albidus]QUJ78191.1 selenide, water dikinase SelD [Sulfitobacter albidus]